ncbi:hypothetical protein ACVIDN_007498 [Rhizobium brockwellii]
MRFILWSSQMGQSLLQNGLFQRGKVTIRALGGRRCQSGGYDAPERAQVFQSKAVWRTPEIARELGHRMQIRSLRCWRKIADRHVIDHAPAQRAYLCHRHLLFKGWAKTAQSFKSEAHHAIPRSKCRDSGFVQS